MNIRDIISAERIRVGLKGTSKKRVLEQMSELLGASGHPDATTIFQALFDRERLGSTGIGEGVALPHGRLPQIEQAMGAFVILKQAIDFDAPDQKPVNMVFALLVPEAATEEHLQLLAQLATLFNNAGTRERLLAATTPEQIDAIFQEANPQKLSA